MGGELQEQSLPQPALSPPRSSQTAMQPAVAIVNYNTADHLRACLASLRAAGAREVVVKDNGSSDGSVALVRREFPEVRVHPDFSNPGYGAGANMAIAACTAPYVVLLNSDT